MNSWLEMQQGTISDQGNERHQRITRVNRSPNRLHYAAAVTNYLDGVAPPWTPEQRILGFTVQLREEDIDCERLCLPNQGFFAPGDAALITLNDRIRAVAPCDVLPGDPVIVMPHVGLPAARGIEVQGATWESATMSGQMGVIQVNTRAERRP